MEIFNQIAPFVAGLAWLNALIFIYAFCATIGSRLLSKDMDLHKATITKLSLNEPNTPITNVITEEYTPYEITYLTIEYSYLVNNKHYTSNIIDKSYWFFPNTWKKTVRFVPANLISELNEAYLTHKEIDVFVHRKWPQLSTIYRHDVRTNSLLAMFGLVLFFLFLGQYILSLGV